MTKFFGKYILHADMYGFKIERNKSAEIHLKL